MTTTSSPRVPVIQPPEERRRAIIRLMECAGHACGVSARTAFQRWLALIESDLCCPIDGCGRLVPDRDCDAHHACRALHREGWNQAVQELEAVLPFFTEALAHAYLHYRASYEDLLGPTFENLGLGGRGGIFFTPWHLAQAMAATSAGDLRDTEDRTAIRVCDPTCGSGVVLLAFLDHVARTRPDLLDRVRPYGMDLDADCVRMCRISLRLVAIGRAERLVDAYGEGDLSAAFLLNERATLPRDEHEKEAP
jgi:hypothetical protein